MSFLSVLVLEILTQTARLQALHIGGQSFALSAPIAQERLDVFKLSQHGCVQVGHIQQKSVVKVCKQNVI